MTKISILTAQKVSIEYDTASWMERAMAFVVDALILVISALIFYNLWRFDEGGLGEIIYYVIWIMVISTYTLWNEYFFNGQTVGKKLMKVKVVRLDGDPGSFGDYFGRWIFRIMDIYFSSGILATFLINSSAKRQRAGDMIANTVVIKDRISMNLTLKEILSLATTENYKPVYDKITKLSEEEMLVIKEAMDRYQSHNNSAHEDAINLLIRKLAVILELKKIPPDKTAFLKTVIKDYIVLTR
jgi:uncharacterized RDD family membrane protein YckC